MSGDSVGPLLASSLVEIGDERWLAAVTGRGELTDEARERIAPLLPENGRRAANFGDHAKRLVHDAA